jgi:adenosylhomocysteinase
MLFDSEHLTDCLPLLSKLGRRWEQLQPFAGKKIALVGHITPIIELLTDNLFKGGGDWTVIEANPDTTEDSVFSKLSRKPIEVLRHTPSGQELVDMQLDLALDVGGELLSNLAMVHQPSAAFQGGIEITTTGSHKLTKRPLPFGVFDISQSALKRGIEARRGVGEGAWCAFTRITGRSISGRRITLLGFGQVGEGVAEYARALGGCVTVVDPSPVRLLQAHYLGYGICSRKEALASAEIIVTAAGSGSVLSIADLRLCQDGIHLFNVSHDGRDLPILELSRRESRKRTEHWTEFMLHDGRRIHLLGSGAPLNIVTNSGSPEHVIIQYALASRCLEWMTVVKPQPGLHTPPITLEEEVAKLALEALGREQFQ